MNNGLAPSPIDVSDKAAIDFNGSRLWLKSIITLTVIAGSDPDIDSAWVDPELQWNSM